MGDEDSTLVRDILKNNLLPLAKNTEGVSDLQFIFALRLLDAVCFPGDRDYGDQFLDRVRGKIGGALRENDRVLPRHLVSLQELLSTDNRDEIHSGIGVLDRPAIEALLEFTNEAEKDVTHQDSLMADQVPVPAIQLQAACIRMATKMVKSGG
jgi:hypothetical protein